MRATKKRNCTTCLNAWHWHTFRGGIRYKPGEGCDMSYLPKFTTRIYRDNICPNWKQDNRNEIN